LWIVVVFLFVPFLLVIVLSLSFFLCFTASD
jgi:hypothetical protein